MPPRPCRSGDRLEAFGSIHSLVAEIANVNLLYNNAGSGGRGGSYPTMLSCVQAAAEKETQKPWFWEQVKEHRCVPKIASPEARKNLL